MNRSEIKRLYDKAWRTWGEKAQLGMLMEECAELIQAVNKYMRFPNKMSTCGRSLAEEIADVEIMIDQVKTHVRCLTDFDKYVETIKQDKLKRLNKVLEKTNDE